MQTRGKTPGVALAGLAAAIVLAGAALWTLTLTATGAEEKPAAKPAEKPGGLPPLTVDKEAPRLSDGPAAKPGGPPPLKVDSGAPLLLDEPSPKTPKRKPNGPVADNSACFVCHTNYDGEEMVVQHAIGNVGCIKCHGESHAHRNDEDNITPPDVMYPAAKIDKACQECHDTHDAPAKKVIAMWQKKCPSKSDAGQLICTDCHGEHRLKQRQVVWDKVTRKLVPRKDGQVIRPTQVPEAQTPSGTME